MGYQNSCPCHQQSIVLCMIPCAERIRIASMLSGGSIVQVSTYGRLYIIEGTKGIGPLGW